MRVCLVDTQLVMGIHVHVLPPLSWVCPEGRLGGPSGKLGLRARMASALPLRMNLSSRQCETNDHQITTKELCQDPKMRSEDSVGPLPATARQEGRS